MRLSNPEAARLVRDASLEAMDALNAILVEGLASMSPAEEKEVRLAVARAMSAVIESIVNPLLRDHPELDVNEDLWGTIAVERARSRVAAHNQ